MRRTLVLTVAAVSAGLGLVATSAAARAATTTDFQLASHAVVVDQTAGTATFRLSFDREPRFFLPDGGEEQADSFQVEIDADATTFERPITFEDIDAVVRGEEISLEDGLPVRDREGDGGEQAGGWGPVRDVLPFDLDGATLTFTTGLQTIGDADGKFRYRVITIADGGVTSEVNAAIIPVPLAVSGGIMMLGGASLLHKLRKRRFC